VSQGLQIGGTSLWPSIRLPPCDAVFVIRKKFSHDCSRTVSKPMRHSGGEGLSSALLVPLVPHASVKIGFMIKPPTKQMAMIA
jgi:hypothetical protein